MVEAYKKWKKEHLYTHNSGDKYDKWKNKKLHKSALDDDGWDMDASSWKDEIEAITNNISETLETLKQADLHAQSISKKVNQYTYRCYQLEKMLSKLAKEPVLYSKLIHDKKDLREEMKKTLKEIGNRPKNQNVKFNKFNLETLIMLLDYFKVEKPLSIKKSERKEKWQQIKDSYKETPLFLKLVSIMLVVLAATFAIFGK